MSGKGKLRFEDETPRLEKASPKSSKPKRRKTIKKDFGGNGETAHTPDKAARLNSPAEIKPLDKGGAASAAMQSEQTNLNNEANPVAQNVFDTRIKEAARKKRKRQRNKLRFRTEPDMPLPLDENSQSGTTPENKAVHDAINTPQGRRERSERAGGNSAAYKNTKESKSDPADIPKNDAAKYAPPQKPRIAANDSASNLTGSDRPGRLNERSGADDRTGDRRSSLRQDQGPADSLRFKKAEKKVDKLEKKAGKYEEKLDKTRKKIPSKKVKKRELVFDEKKGKSKSKLSFYDKPLPIGEARWNKPQKKPLTHKAAGTARSTAVNKIHSKVYQHEDENAGTKAAHRAELMGESAYRGAKRSVQSAYRFVKNSPYRRAAKLESLSVKNEAKLSFQRAVRDNPKLQSNPLSRLFQRRSIRRQYAASFRNANKSVKAAKKAVKTAKRASGLVSNVIRRNPLALIYGGIFILLLFVIMALFTTCMSLFSGGSGFAGELSYTATDTDIDDAELIYTEWETGLRMEISEVESSRRGYDEYRYNVGEIGHDPLTLMAYLTAVYEDFSFPDIETALRAIFSEQYLMEFIPETETRTRLETRTGSYYDNELGETVYYDYDVEVDYEWRILTVNLTVRPLSEVLSPLMTAEQRTRFEKLMFTNGARQYVGSPFDADWLPNVTSKYGYRIHPITGERDNHKGVDIAFPAGTEIMAGLDGTVITVGYDADGYGNYVIIDNGEGLQARYAHCSRVLVSEGQKVTQGTVIAEVGSTGSSTGPHLHMEVLKDGQHINPLYFSETNGSVNQSD
ncbi:MAG: peptidoglycan DD-metalloendopeptidase family protein [Clostridiales bacterium]|jgi:murein DD-endopeptidase MepM/ murein hydrolase activator NlpD|nr:peptidoglycan DD-metalloendopeptidase family protein [Clostridiales bacterium]